MISSRICGLLFLAGMACMAISGRAYAKVMAAAGMSVSVTVLPGCGAPGCHVDQAQVTKVVSIQRGLATDPANPPPSLASVNRMMVVTY